MAVVTFEVNFFGRVQGVGFRFLCLRKANQLGLTGWVKNSHRFDEVETILQGEKSKVDELINYFKENPYFVRVERFTKNEILNPEKFKSFEVRY
jgi:acylphosphatase